MAESNREEITKLEALYASNPGGRVFVHLAEACRKGGEHERARGILDEGLARHTDSASGYVVLGRVLSDLGETDEAAAAFTRVLQLDPGNLIALRWLGDSARDEGRFDEAAAHYRDLLARSPNDDSIRELLASCEAASHGVRDDAGSADVAGSPRDADRSNDDVPDDASAEEELAPISPFATAPGQTDDGPDGSVELVEVEQESLPGDLASFANLEHGGARSAPDDEEEPPETDIESLDWSGMGDVADDAFVADLDTGLNTGFADDSVSPGDGVDELNASPLDVKALDAAAGGVTPFEPPLFEEPSWAEELPGDAEDEAEFGDEAGIELEAGAEVGAAPDSADEDAVGGADEDAFDVADEIAGEVELEGGEETDAEMRPSEPDPELAAVVDGGPDEEVFELLTEEAELEAAQAAAADTPPVAGLEAGGYGDALGGPIEDLDRADEGLQTETIAELYSSQGFHDRAAEVYRTLLRRRPGDERLEARLAESEAAMRPPVTGPSLVEEDESGEVWLSAAGSAWTGTTDDASEPSPYGWTESGDEGAAAPPIRSYLQALIGWRATDPAAVSGAAEPAAAGSAGEHAAPQPSPAAPVANAEPAAAASTAADADSDSAGWTPADIEAEPWGASGAPAASPPAPAASAPAPAEPAPPAQPAAPAARVESPAAPAGRPAAPRRSGGDPVEDAFLDWYEGAEPAAPSAAPQAAEPAAAAEAAVPEDQAGPVETAAPWEQTGSVEAGSSVDEPSAAVGASADPASDAMGRLEETSSPAEETTDESDEDLEMFRSWLQSLKK